MVPVDRDTQSNSAPRSERTGPADRFGHLFHLISDAVVEIEIIEDDPVVREVNPGFEEIFGYDRETVRGESLNEFILPADHDNRADDFDKRTAEGKENSAIVERKTAAGTREFLYRGVPYEGSDGGRYGFAIYSDITEQQKYERHSRVMHRILRHNIRNDLSVVIGLADHLQDQLDDPELQELATRILDHANRVATVGEETQALEAVLDDDVQPESIDVTTECRDAVGRALENRTSWDVSVDVPEGVRALAVPQLGTAVESLVENALVHAGEDPSVEVVVRETAGQVVVEVLDDGPGIPEHERAPVFEDQDVTQLQHGSGIGLWLVRWTVEACGGELEYEREDGRTVVRLVLRDGAGTYQERSDSQN